MVEGRGHPESFLKRKKKWIAHPFAVTGGGASNPHIFTQVGKKKGQLPEKKREGRGVKLILIRSPQNESLIPHLQSREKKGKGTQKYDFWGGEKRGRVGKRSRPYREMSRKGTLDMVVFLSSTKRGGRRDRRKKKKEEVKHRKGPVKFSLSKKEKFRTRIVGKGEKGGSRLFCGKRGVD